jgi:flagellar basal-body rod modification protein FlgD
MSTLPISSIAALSPQAVSASSSSGSTSSGSSSSSPAAATNLASENVFLQLLVAQLQNQDPEQPTDGTAFVTELAQFTTLQEDTESATDLDTIVAALPTDPSALSPAPSATTTTSNTTNGINQ